MSRPLFEFIFQEATAAPWKRYAPFGTATCLSSQAVSDALPV
jgi:hypothetical protein